MSDQYRDAGNLSARITLHERYSTNKYGWFRWVIDQFDLPTQAIVLEVGCGSGKLWSENVDRIPPGWQVFLSDFSPGMVHGCRAALMQERHRFTFEISSATDIPFSPATFDAVIANHMLYHVPHRPRALAEIARVLKPSGCLYAATNGEKHLLELDALIEQYYQPADSYLSPGKPSRHFTLENGGAQLAPWFKQVEVRHYQDSLVVTEAEPLLAYVKSMIPRDQYRGDRSTDQLFEQAIRKLVQQQGSLCIQKSSGIFIGKK